ALSRPVDVTGLLAWNQAFAAGAAPAQVALAVLSSAEAEQRFVQGLYARFLGRTGNAQEIAGWAQALESGATQQQVLAQIAGSPESVSFQASGILNELASGALTSNPPAPQQLFVQFKAGATA